jgi:hypothetical protein
VGASSFVAADSRPGKNAAIKVDDSQRRNAIQENEYGVMKECVASMAGPLPKASLHAKRDAARSLGES